MNSTNPSFLLATAGKREWRNKGYSGGWALAHTGNATRRNRAESNCGGMEPGGSTEQSSRGSFPAGGTRESLALATRRPVLEEANPLSHLSTCGGS